MSVVHLTEGAFDKAITQGVTLVDFWATWCGPCKMLAPVMEELAGRYEGKAAIAKVDVDAEPALACRFGVVSVPTMVLFRDGAEIDRRVGFQSADACARMLDAQL